MAHTGDLLNDRLFGVGRNNGHLGIYISNISYTASLIQAQCVSYAIDLSLSKENQAEFALLGEKRTHCTCLLLEIKRAGTLFEIGTSFIFKE